MDREENIVEKGESTGYKLFSPFTATVLKAFFLRVLKKKPSKK